MPTYEYVCKSCGNAWEASQRISEAPLTECPKCHAAAAQRQISGGNFILKGGGWYADLYASSPKKSAPKEGGEAKAESKTETKSETKSETAAAPSTTTTTTSTSTSTSTEKK